MSSHTTHIRRKTIFARNIDDLKTQESRMSNNVFYRVFQYTLHSFAKKTGTLVVFHGAYKFKEIARIQILFDVGPKVGCLSFQSRFTWSDMECTLQPSENFGRKVFQDDSTKTGRKICFAASGFRNFPPKSLDDERTSNRYLFAAPSLSHANHPPI